MVDIEDGVISWLAEARLQAFWDDVEKNYRCSGL